MKREPSSAASACRPRAGSRSARCAADPCRRCRAALRGAAIAQAPRAPAAASSAAAPVREEGVRWQALTPPQREALAPLERDWPGIDAPRKQKWLAAGRPLQHAPARGARPHQRREWSSGPSSPPPSAARPRLRFEEARQMPVARSAASVARPTRRCRLSSAASWPPAPPPPPAPRASAGIEAGRGARDSKEAKCNVVPEPGAGAAAAPGRADDGPGRARRDDDA